MIGTPTLDRKTRRHLATKAEVVAAAWEIAATEGVGGITIRDLAERVGLKAPSLYEYFPSKNAVYDAMFVDGWRTFREVMAVGAARRRPARPCCSPCRSTWRGSGWTSRPGSRSSASGPSPASSRRAQAYAEATAVLDDIAAEMASHGLTDPRAIDLFIAMVTGLVSQQIANEPDRRPLAAAARLGGGHVPDISDRQGDGDGMTTATANELTTAARAMNRTQAADFCATEYARLAALLRELTPDEWRRPTDCAPWDVRAMAGHLVGAAEAASLAAFMRQALAGMRVHRKPGLGNLVDGINEVQIREQASRSTGALVDALERAAPAPGARAAQPGLVHAAHAAAHAGELGLAAHAEGARAQP